MRISEHMVAVPHLPPALSGLRVVQLTDFHRSRLTSDAVLKEAVREANALAPDLILLTGDYVTDMPRDIAPAGEILTPLQARFGVIACLGNHDYTAGAKAVTTELRERGITVLVNESVEIAPGLRVIGLDEDRHGKPDIARAWQCVAPNEAALVLAHNPAFAERLSEYACIVFSGHTHGGQIKLPILTAREVRRIGAKHYVDGWFTLGQARLYVNSGLGQVGMPFRFRVPPEVAVFTLIPALQAGE